MKQMQLANESLISGFGWSVYRDLARVRGSSVWLVDHILATSARWKTWHAAAAMARDGKGSGRV
jgi:hypothetical protein